MGKHLNRNKRRNPRDLETAEIIRFRGTKFAHERELPPIKPLTPTQADYLDALRSSPQVVVLGPAGTGKTWMAATHAADLYRLKQISKIIITRPNVPCGRSLDSSRLFARQIHALGHPDPRSRQGADRNGAYEIALKSEGIELVPFEVMRGRSWKDAFVILDEAQNTTATEVKTFLTRVGENCTVVINGDVSQCDLGEASGLRTMLGSSGRKSFPCR